MNIELSWKVNNFGTAVRVAFVFVIIRFYRFGMPGFEYTGNISLPALPAVIAGCLFCVISCVTTKLASSNSMKRYALVLFSFIGYLYLVYGSNYAQLFGLCSKVFPVFVWILSSLLPLIGTKEFEKYCDDPSLLFTSKEDTENKLLNYSIRLILESWIQCHLFATTINLLRCTLYVSG